MRTVAYLRFKAIKWAARNDRNSRAAMLMNAIEENQRKELTRSEMESIKRILKQHSK